MAGKEVWADYMEGAFPVPPEAEVHDHAENLGSKLLSLPDGRSVRAEVQDRDGFIFVMYTFSAIGLECQKKTDVVNYMVRCGFPLDNPQLEVGVSQYNCDGALFYRILVCLKAVAEEDLPG